MRKGILALITLIMLTDHALALPEGRKLECAPFERAQANAARIGLGEYRVLTPEQFQFTRAIAVMMLDTPDGLPPGDRAAMALSADKQSASVVFLDGDTACTAIKLLSEGIKMVEQVGRGEIVHQGDPT